MTFAGLIRRLLPVLAVFILGCAAQPPRPGPQAQSAWLQHRATLEALHDWQVQGRVALRTDDEGWSANFDWQQRGSDYRIRLRGPFGQGAVELHGNELGVWLQQAEQLPVFALDAETLLEQQTGWRLPVAGLAAWLRGVPVAGTESELAWDAQGRLQHLAQNGWQIDYQRYLEKNALMLPQKLRLQRDSVRVKFIIDDWQTP